MRIKISKSQWEQIGKTAGWMKKAQSAVGGNPIKYTFEPEYEINQIATYGVKMSSDHLDEIAAYIEKSPEGQNFNEMLKQKRLPSYNDFIAEMQKRNFVRLNLVPN